VRHFASERFWRLYNKFPHHIQQLADKSFDLLKENPRHPSLHFKKVGQLWSVRVGAHYRALATEEGDDFIWFWIGNHDEYNRLIS
jgi:hypothetical protein